MTYCDNFIIFAKLRFNNEKGPHEAGLSKIVLQAD